MTRGKKEEEKKLCEPLSTASLHILLALRGAESFSIFSSVRGKREKTLYSYNLKKVIFFGDWRGGAVKNRGGSY